MRNYDQQLAAAEKELAAAELRYRQRKITTRLLLSIKKKVNDLKKLAAQ